MFLEIAKLKQIPEEIRLEILYIYLLFLAKKQSYLLTEGWLMIRCYLNKIQMTKICSLPQLLDLVIYPSFNVGIGIKSFVFAYVWLYPRGFIPKHQIFNLYKFRCHRSLETRLVPRPMASTLKAERLRASAGQASYGTRWLMTCKMACKVLKVKRPFKICNSERINKKGIVCSDLEDLKRISCEHFSLTNGCRAFLESDGTEIVNDEYFQFLPVQTLFMVTSVKEQWVSNVGRSWKVFVTDNDLELMILNCLSKILLLLNYKSTTLTIVNNTKLIYHSVSRQSLWSV